MRPPLSSPRTRRAPPASAAARLDRIRAATQQVKAAAGGARKPATLSSSLLLTCCGFRVSLVSLVTVYISKLDLGTSTTLYRFSLNGSVPSPWKPCSADPQEVASFLVSESKALVSRAPLPRLFPVCSLRLTKAACNESCFCVWIGL